MILRWEVYQQAGSNVSVMLLFVLQATLGVHLRFGLFIRASIKVKTYIGCLVALPQRISTQLK